MRGVQQGGGARRVLPDAVQCRGSDASVQPCHEGQDRSGRSLAARTRCQAWSAISKAEREREQFKRPGLAGGKQVSLDQPVDEQTGAGGAGHR